MVLALSCYCLHASAHAPPLIDLTDYIGGSFVVEFPAGQTTVMVQVPINDDSERCECVEIFKASFEVPDAAAMLGVVPGVNDTADIFIIDDECELIFCAH